MKQNIWKIFGLKAAFALLAVAVVCWFFAPPSSAQRKRNTARSSQRRAAVKAYNVFYHTTKEHRQSCSDCHRAPTGFSTAETAGDEKYRYPDINDYPGHDSCVNCHRQQFFNGARPQICTICHTRVSPRDKVRFAFPVPSKADEFATRFPHDIHQDLIAGKTPTEAQPGGNKKIDYNSCTICHYLADKTSYRVVSRKPQAVQLEQGLVASPHNEKSSFEEGFFRLSPSGHDSCFNCHYSEVKPTRNDCAGCHILNRQSGAELNRFERMSLKFNHDEKNESNTPHPHNLECSKCHVRITQSADVRSLDPDVPFFTCVSCHNTQIKEEVKKRNDALTARQTNAQQQIFTCTYCHDSYVGSFQIPESHKAVK